jgi:Family of unknown function (DUF6156)
MRLSVLPWSVLPLSLLPMALTTFVIAVLAARIVRARARRRHDRIEYYAGWGGDHHPIVLENRITRDEANAITTNGAAYLIGYYGEKGRLIRVVKLIRGEFFFEYRYNYHPNGRLKRARITRGSRVTVLEYDECGRRISDASIAF